MKTGIIIASAAAVVGIGAITYYFVTRPQVASQSLLPGAPQPSSPSGTSANLLDVFNQVKSYLPTQQLQPAQPASAYENRLIRINRDRVYLVKDGLLRYVSALPLSDGRGWESVTDLKSTDINIPEGPSLNGLGVTARLLQ